VDNDKLEVRDWHLQSPYLPFMLAKRLGTVYLKFELLLDSNTIKFHLINILFHAM
jgi:hypothetical protein